MAETAVNFVIDKLAPLLTDEAKLLRGVHTDVSGLIAELQIIQPFLRNADEKADKGELDEGVKAWVKQVRKISYQIEDVVDEYMLHLTQGPQECGCISFLHKVAHLIKTLKLRHDIASEMQDIKATIREIKERGQTYGFSSIEQGSSSNGTNIAWNDPRVGSLFIEEAEVVGIESPRDELIRWLVHGSLKRVAISVVGRGGLGKTTLVKKVYDNQIVSGHFDCHAWIPVSQSYKMQEVLKTMIRQFYKEKRESIPDEINEMDVTSLISKMRDYLDGKRYVVVFDDVWDIEFWGFIKHALPDKDSKGSRIVFTTRIDGVAASCKESAFDYVHKLQPLPPHKARELFRKKAFQMGVCPPHLENLSGEIVKRCEGLPLAIVTIGGILATKEKAVPLWQTFLNSLGSELESNPRLKGMKRIISLSYIDLPYYLKLCYLYFGIFPEDYSIKCARLIRLWIAEGFVKGKKGKTLEEVAQEYLTELINRSLVQVSWVDFDGKARSCRVHDLMREIILLKWEDLCFCEIFPKEDSGFESSDISIRRLSIHSSDDNVLASITDGSRIRSVFTFDANELPETFLGLLFAKFKLLKTLDFEDTPLHGLPEEVGDLFHLRYLSVRNTKTKVLPKSIGRLRNLLTLDLKFSLVSELPAEINWLHKLRHLLAYSYHQNIDFPNDRRGVKMVNGFGCLEALQKLYYVEANDGPGLIKELRKLRQLRKLGITKLKSEDGEALCTAIEKMIHLESLEVTSVRMDDILDLQHIASPPGFLRRLYLVGRLEKFPDWISKLQNVVRLRLIFSALTEDPLKYLQALPSLFELVIYCAYEGELLSFREGGFQKLKFLRLVNMNALNSVIIDKGALPLLQKLYIESCPHLKEVPSGIQHLRNIRTLLFIDMPDEFTARMLPNEGPDYWVVVQIPRVLFYRKRGVGKYETYTLQ